ncbi:unnamed protein product [Cylicocyclus nassatus]|uniref:Uncharacterized protein n=1 Tax=Cylicocyclus nassatus TaxID=53992 RepID=A0AA36M8H6_CYLNA|nr:unnamed protein product [Cylicocyclus nassatus]
MRGKVFGQPGRLHEDDMQSLSLRYKLAVQEDGFRRFEAPTPSNGASFRIIIITPDQTELIKRYELKLATMMVVDNYGRSLPAAFLLANKMGKEESGLLFEETVLSQSSREMGAVLQNCSHSKYNHGFGTLASYFEVHATQSIIEPPGTRIGADFD